jgi:ribosomal protein S18 acetylase RimI-like enzyme
MFDDGQPVVALMITLKHWGLWKPKTRATRVTMDNAPVAVSTPSARQRPLPSPALRWLADGRVALRAFDFECDAPAVCAFQPETYTENFPDFRYTPSFANAFRHDLRRATLDPHNALYVLDDGRERDNLIGFLWVVVCQNNWTGERYGYVNNLFVVAHRRAQGLGSELMRQAEKFFRERGVKRVRLSVTADNAGAVALYRKSGYRVQRWEMEKDL